MTVGFTGTRKGMTPDQVRVISDLLDKLGTKGPKVAHHGDCIGADTDFDALSKNRGYWVIGHPSDLSTRSYCKVDECREVKRPVVRDHDIVDDVEIMLACPKGFTEEKWPQHSGTWTTIRYCWKVKRPLVIVYPDGKAERFN